MNNERRDSRQQPLKVGLYDIERTIGKGNFAVVKLAKHRITKTQVAIKIIDKSQLDEANLQKVHREVQIMKLLRHPNILKLYQVMETDNMLYLVTEYATNGEMFAYIDRNGRLPENEARRVFRQILSAVEHCHKRHVVHRDLKTENVLLDENLNIKMADFGFGNYFVQDELLKTFCGSPPYAAPEVFEGKMYDGPAVDAWSLGVVLYVLVCAALPFDGTKLHEVRDRVLEGRYRVPYFMSTELEDLIKHILVKNAQQRYTLEQIRMHPWMQRSDDGQGYHDNALTDRNDLLIESAVDKGLQGEFNAQVLALMRELKIDEEKTKLAVMRNSYDHHSAIYYLLLERLKQHRSSYPERSQTSTRLRRASVTADQIVVRNGIVEKVVMPTAVSMLQPIPKWTPVQYAMRELHLGEVTVPQDMQSVGPGLGVEMRPSVTVAAITTAASTTTSSCQVLKPTPTVALRARGVMNETIDEAMDESNELRGTQHAEEARPRRRRAAIQPMPPAMQDTLYVPANHPLLRQDTGDSQCQPDKTMEDDGTNDSIDSSQVIGEAHGFKIQIIPPVEPSPPVSSRFHHGVPTAQAASPKNSRLSMTLSPRNFNAFTEGRRASDGNSANAPFRQLLRKSDVQCNLQGSMGEAMEVMMLQCEHQELQQLYRRCLTPDEARQQQMQHSLFMEKLDERIGFVPIDNAGSQQQLHSAHLPNHHVAFQDFRSGGSLRQLPGFDLADPMRQLNIHASQHVTPTSSSEFNVNTDNNNTLGPFRRQASYRKLANSPIPHHGRSGNYKRPIPQRLQADSSPYSSFELEAAWASS